MAGPDQRELSAYHSNDKYDDDQDKQNVYSKDGTAIKTTSKNSGGPGSVGSFEAGKAGKAVRCPKVPCVNDYDFVLQNIHLLPLEIRRMIHRELLVVEKVFPSFVPEYDGHLPTDTTGKVYQLPDPNWIFELYEISEELGDEAENVLYYENTIVLTEDNWTEFLGEEDVVDCCTGPGYEASERRKGNIRFVEVLIDSGCYDRWSYKQDVRSAWADHTLDTEAKRREHIHDLSCLHLNHHYWAPLLEEINSLYLKYLEINLVDVTCPQGCCRLIKDVGEQLHFWDTKMPDKIVITGAADQAEQDKLMEIMNWTLSDMGRSSENSGASEEDGHGDSDESDGSDERGGSEGSDGSDASDESDESDEVDGSGVPEGPKPQGQDGKKRIKITLRV